MHLESPPVTISHSALVWVIFSARSRLHCILTAPRRGGASWPLPLRVRFCGSHPPGLSRPTLLLLPDLSIPSRFSEEAFAVYLPCLKSVSYISISVFLTPLTR